MGQAELGAYVQSHLLKRGIDVILSGGAVVAVYTSGQYVTRDLDFVNRYQARRQDIKQAMEELGFVEEGRHFVHPESDHIVDFPPGPLAVGEDHLDQISEIRTEMGTLRVISPTDCVKDRLAWYYHFGDRQCLHQAVMVSRDNQIDLKEIMLWSEGKGKLDEFERISGMFSNSN